MSVWLCFVLLINWQIIKKICQNCIDDIHQQCLRSNYKITNNKSYFSSSDADLLSVLPHLNKEKRSERQNQKHDQYSSCIENIFISLTIFNLHVVPLDVIWLVCVTYFDRLSADCQERWIGFILTNEVVSVVLIFERNESFSCEMSQLKTFNLVVILYKMLT